MEKFAAAIFRHVGLDCGEKRTGEETVVTEFFKARKQKEGEGE